MTRVLAWLGWASPSGPRLEYMPVLRRQGGQALVETAIVSVLLVTLLMGIFEFGRLWMIGNMITVAASDGARMASIVPAEERQGGVIAGSSLHDIEDQVTKQLGKSGLDNLASLPPSLCRNSQGKFRWSASK